MNKIGFSRSRSAASVLAMLVLLAVAGLPAQAQVNLQDTPQDAAQELKFREFFTLPVGPRGLEPSARVLALQGQRVRLVGYMARQDAADAMPGVILLTPLPVTLGDEDERYADDLPASTVYAHFAADFSAAAQAPAIPYLPGLLALSGRLELGSSPEADGRHSMLRLQLDRPSAAMLSHAAGAAISHSTLKN